ncbi:ATP-binding protein [Flavobacterium granuli]|uniref:histidine kinase n=1 Tax=Flavobacterium granuli TaxID=280093 RepID=A0ABU1S543_9FLAO|nr:ATP-binding protein [Flavobacterium granuli]MDR6846158.1 signal transduction histidine kinase/CheY-like chemotaxis protein [Flavobacterium granuli]
MKLTLKLTTYSKLVLLIIGICSLFLMLFLSLYLYTVQQEDDVFKTNSNQYKSEISRLFDFNSKMQIVTINDLTYWDALVNFAKSRDMAWYDSHIANEFPTYEVDYIGVYNLEKVNIAKSSNAYFKSNNFIPIRAMMHLYKSKFSRFYLRVPEGVIEVFGGTIHATNDPKKVKTNPSGYFFTARLLDKQYFKNLEEICSSKIQFLDKVGKDTIGNKKVSSVIKLRDADNRVVAKLLFQRPSHLNFEKTKELLLIIVIATLISLIAAIYYSRKWVYRPLRLITTILESDREISISLLKREPGEFGYIGNLFEDHRRNRFQLEKSKEKAEESDKLKSTFLANLSHEIRTPMNAIIGFSDLLMDDKLDEEFKKKYLKIINTSGKSLVSIIEDLIEMSKIDAKQIAPKFKGLNIEKCLNELYNTLKVTIPDDKNIKFYQLENSAKLPNDVLTDEIKLKQIIVNLLTNAIKFTDSGHVAFGYNICPNNDFLEFRVEDTGIGISEKDLKVIFDRFRRVEDDYSISLSGLGLGLSISKAYVEMLGGEITVESVFGGGSVFKFTIPLRYDETAHEENDTLPEIAYNESEGKTILVAEDDNINFLLLKTILEKKNHIVLRAKNGQEVVDISASESNIDLIFMDIKMPVLDGYEAFEIIKKDNPDRIVIAQTAHSSSEVKESIMKAGFSGYITKPLDKEKIFELINQVFQNNSIT